jgi:hypothetical protein
LWRGLEQTASKSKARLIERQHYAPRTKRQFLRGCEGTDKLMRRTILVKLNSSKTLRNQAVSAKFTDSDALFCYDADCLKLVPDSIRAPTFLAFRQQKRQYAASHGN